MRLLHHPDAARRLPQPARATRSCGKRARWRRAASRSCCSSRRTRRFYGIDRHERGALARLLRELNAIDGLEWIRLLYLYPTTIDDDDAGGDGRVRQGLQVHRPAAAARVERGAQADEAARHAADVRHAARPHPRRGSPASRSARRSSSASPARPSRTSTSSAAFVERPRVRPRRRLHLLARGRHVGATRSTTTCRRERKTARRRRVMGLQKRLVPARQRAPDRRAGRGCWSTARRPTTSWC